MRLSPETARAVTYQSYAPAPEIEGVRCLPIKKHQLLEGWFMEYMRLDGGKARGSDLEVRQISLSRVVPFRINAFHVHPKTVQDEIWCVLEGNLAVWLVDLREGSPTLGVKRRLLLSGEAPQHLYIPSGVAHGYQAGASPVLLIYSMNSQFCTEDPNEGRLPWDHFGRELWQEDRG